MKKYIECCHMECKENSKYWIKTGICEFLYACENHIEDLTEENDIIGDVNCYH